MPTPNATMPSTPTQMTSPPAMPLALPGETIHPYICWGFKIDDSVVYLSDVSHIPDDSWPVLESVSGKLPVFVLDCLYLQPHTSHYGLAQALATARKVAARRTYLVGFSHAVSHNEYVTLGEAIGGKLIEDKSQLTDKEQEGLAIIEEGEGEKVWVRPGHDGLRVCVDCQGAVSDDSYD